jgi:hypothetical protein
MFFMIDSLLFNVQRQISNAYLGRKYVTQCINISILCMRFIKKIYRNEVEGYNRCNDVMMFQQLYD